MERRGDGIMVSRVRLPILGNVYTLSIAIVLHFGGEASLTHGHMAWLPPVKFFSLEAPRNCQWGAPYINAVGATPYYFFSSGEGI